MKDDKSKENIKTFFLNKEEKEKIQNIQSVVGILAILREGLNHSLYIEIERAKNRLHVDHKAPEGFDRIVDFDVNQYALLVIDREKVKQPENPENKSNEAKN